MKYDAVSLDCLEYDGKRYRFDPPIRFEVEYTETADAEVTHPLWVYACEELTLCGWGETQEAAIRELACDLDFLWSDIVCCDDSMLEQGAIELKKRLLARVTVTAI